MAQVMMPQRKDNSAAMGTIGSLAGNAIVPGVGGAVGGMAGSKAGQAGPQPSPVQAKSNVQAPMAPQMESGDAMMRRLQELEAQRKASFGG
jgi:hypothetical protein